MTLEQIRFQPKSGLPGTRTAYDQYIFIPGILGIGRAIGHHQPLSLRENNVILEFWCYEWGDILGITPPSGAVFLVVAIFFRICASEIYGHPESYTANYTQAQVKWMEAGEKIPESNWD